MATLLALSRIRPMAVACARRCASSTVVDRFTLLEVERRFDIDERHLTQRYKALMSNSHPDRHGCSGAAVQQQAADHAAELTDAYRVLRSPHSRAVHLLELLGAPLNEETGGDLLGAGFLMQVMEVREELEEAGTQPARLQALRAANDVAVGELHVLLGGAFASQDLEQARSLTAQLQYLQRIEDEIHARMPVK